MPPALSVNCFSGCPVHVDPSSGLRTAAVRVRLSGQSMPLRKPCHCWSLAARPPFPVGCGRTAFARTSECLPSPEPPCEAAAPYGAHPAARGTASG